MNQNDKWTNALVERKTGNDVEEILLATASAMKREEKSGREFKLNHRHGLVQFSSGKQPARLKSAVPGTTSIHVGQPFFEQSEVQILAYLKMSAT